MSQKYKKGELSVITPSGKIKSESKTERAKRYGKSTVVHKTAKFDDSVLNGSVMSADNKSKAKMRDSISHRKKLSKTTNPIIEGDEFDPEQKEKL